MRARFVGDVEHHRHPPRRHVGQRFHVGKLGAPIARNVDLGDRSAIAALSLVEIDQPVDHRLARHHLDLRIERGADRQAAFVEFLLAVIVVDVAPHLFGEIFGGENMGAGRPHRDVERLLLRLLGDIGRDVAVFRHAIDDVIAPRDRFVALAERIVIVRTLRQGGEVGGFRDRKLVHRLVEIEQRRRRDAIGAEAEIDFVEIKLEDFFFRVSAFDAQRQ